MAKLFTSLVDPELIELIRSGAVGVIPTDTVYGLVGLASRSDTLTRINLLKQRSNKPGTIIASSVAQLYALGLNNHDLSIAASYWPNPLSIVIASNPKAIQLDFGLGSVAVRVTNNQVVAKLLSITGPLVSSSANIADQAVVTTVEAAQALFSDKVDFYVDGGDLSGRQASTIARLIEGGLEIIRDGAFRPPAN